MSKEKSYETVLWMNADKLSVKMHAVEMILPKPGNVFLKEWTKSDKKNKTVMHLKKFMPL